MGKTNRIEIEHGRLTECLGEDMQWFTTVTTSDGKVKFTKQRFRPTLRQYRILEAANKFLTEAIDTQNKDFFQALSAKDAYRNELETQKLISKDLLERCNEYRKNGDRAIRLNWFLVALNVSITAYLNYIIWF